MRFLPFSTRRFSSPTPASWAVPPPPLPLWSATWFLCVMIGVPTISLGSAPAPDVDSLVVSPPAQPVDPQVMVTVARAHLLVLRGAYDAAVAELNPVVSRSVEARYLRGIALARLEAWRQASRDLSIVAASPSADRFPRLNLELGIVRARLGAWEEARYLLENAARSPATAREARIHLEQLAAPPLAVPRGPERRRDWAAQASLGLGFNSNVPFFPSNQASPCSTQYLGSFAGGRWLDRTCGVVGNERIGITFRPSPPRTRAVAAYRFLHQWYLNRDLALFDAQDHRAAATIAWRSGIEAGYQAHLLALHNRYRPVRSVIQAARVRFNKSVSGPTGIWIEYRAGWARHANLTETWDVFANTADLCMPEIDPANPDAQYCTAAQGGLEQTAGVGFDWPGPRAGMGWVTSVTWRHASMLYRGTATRFGLWTDTRLGRRGRLESRLDYQVLSYPARPEPVRVSRIQASLTLATPLSQQTEVLLGYVVTAARRTGPSPAQFQRHVTRLEVSHAF